MFETVLQNLQTIGLSLLIFILFWISNTVASLTLNIKVTNNEQWDKDKFLKSLWKLGGMIGTIVLLTVGLSMIQTEIFSIEALSNVIIAAALTKLAEAVTKVKDMFGYTTSNIIHPKEEEEEKEEEIIIPVPIEEEGSDEDEYYEG